MSIGTIGDELAGIDDEIARLEDERTALTNRIDCASARKKSMSKSMTNLIPFPNPSGIRITKDTGKWLSNPRSPSPKPKK